MILSTPNRTPLSRLAMITLGEGLGHIPRGTHDWDKFIAPDELTALLGDAGLRVIDTTGFAYDPVRGGRLTENLSLDYFMTVVQA
jgi:2-polyprenyl-6-hydroxyphenyl methylase/3-demethylubiquinone-9 3-methyltransferase